MFTSAIVFAQDYPRHYLQFNIGGNTVNSWYSGTSKNSNTGQPKYGYRTELSDPASWFPNYRQTYISYEAIIPLTFSAQYFYAVTHWLHIGGEVYYSGNYRNLRKTTLVRN